MMSNVPTNNRFTDVIGVRAMTSRTIEGETFAYDDTGTGEPIWGRGETSAWERGEPTMIFGPTAWGRPR